MYFIQTYSARTYNYTTVFFIDLMLIYIFLRKTTEAYLGHGRKKLPDYYFARAIHYFARAIYCHNNETRNSKSPGRNSNRGIFFLPSPKYTSVKNITSCVVKTSYSLSRKLKHNGAMHGSHLGQIAQYEDQWCTLVQVGLSPSCTSAKSRI